MPKTLRAGIAGAGFMAGVHARAIRDSGHEVVGISGSSPESSFRAANRLNVEKAFSSWQELVSSPEVDVVHICTPNELHAPIIRAAVAAGKQIVCEKPISVSLEEALEIKQVVESGDSGFVVPLAYRFYPMVRELRGRVLSGQAGDIHLMHGSYLQDWLSASFSSNWRVDSTAGGKSRAFADIGMHWCDLMEFVSSDRIVRLIANTSKAHQSRSGQPVLTEDIANIIFETERGASGTLTVSQVSLGRKNRLWLELDGSKASFSFDQENPDSLWIGGVSSNQIVMRGQESLNSPDATRFSQVPSGHPQGYQDAFNSFMADAYASFEGTQVDGLPVLVDGVRSAALVHAVLESAAQKKWVEVLQVHEQDQDKVLTSK
jgi:predicted dehydrogenase